MDPAQAQAAGDAPAGPGWMASLSVFLGLSSLLAVLCFHFPEWLTSREFRQVYTEGFARNLVLLGLVLAFGCGLSSLLRGRARRWSMLGIGSATLAVMLGGATVPFDPIRASPFTLGLDWFLVSLFFSALVFVPIERMLAARAQSVLRPGWRTDLAYFFLGHVGIQFILIAITASTSWVLSWAAYAPLEGFLQAWPLFAQFLLAVFVADLAQSLVHRAYHGVPLLWRLHAIHHSSTHLDWLAGSRMHLLEVVLTRSLVLLPLLWLGFDPRVVNAYVILVGLQAVLAHANLGVRFGWLEYLLVLPRYHHWHHARDPAYAHKNFAIHLPLIDMLMGTFRLPRQGWPEQYGLQEPSEVPEGIWRQHWNAILPRTPARRPLA